MIEYHTVCIRPVMPPKPLSNTYREKLIARQGGRAWRSSPSTAARLSPGRREEP